MTGLKKKKALFGGALRCAGLAAVAMTAHASADIVPSTTYLGSGSEIWGWDAAYTEVFNLAQSGTFPRNLSYSGLGLDISSYASSTVVGVNTSLADPAPWTFTWVNVSQYFTVANTKEMLVEWDLVGWDSYVNSALFVYEFGVGMIFTAYASDPAGSTTLTLLPGIEYAFGATMVGVHGDGNDNSGFARMSNVPAPGALAIFGIGLITARRRRRA